MATGPKIDYLGAALFAGALVPILVGLTNKQTADWTDLSVAGLIALGALVLGAFVWVESRAAEPIVPLDLFRNRAFTVSVAAAFLAMFGFFAAVVFLPRWFQVVGGSSATISGYQMLPLLGGLIFSAVASGQVVARTGRYRWLVFGALVATAAGLAMLTQLRADTPLPLLWLAMLVTGIGVGPTFAVLPLIVQNSVPVRQIGSAVSNLSFFQQVGGTVGLAITGTVFATSLTRELPASLGAAGSRLRSAGRSPGPVARSRSVAWATWGRRSWPRCRPTSAGSWSRSSRPSSGRSTRRSRSRRRARLPSES